LLLTVCSRSRLEAPRAAARARPSGGSATVGNHGLHSRYLSFGIRIYISFLRLSIPSFGIITFRSFLRW